MKKRCLFVFAAALHTACFAQINLYRAAEQTANNLYLAKNFADCGPAYLRLYALSDFAPQRAAALYNAACCYALNNRTDSALLLVQKAVEAGYDNREQLLQDADLRSIREAPTFQALVTSLPPAAAVNTDPSKLNLVTADLHHFWEAYDKAAGDSSGLEKYMREIYFAQASKGMQDYFSTKVAGITPFVQHLLKHPKFYATARQNTLAPDRYRRQMRNSFKKLKRLYPDAKFPDVVFVMGAFTSGGTVSPNGLLLGINQMSSGPGVELGEVAPRTRMLMNQSAYLPSIVAHELIHFQQDSMRGDTTNLKYAIVEGMADFIGELISGKVANPELHGWAKGKEVRIWSRFKAEMLNNDYNAWIANSSTVPEGEAADQGYWVGYQICRAYYEKAKDKKRAVRDMLTIQDYGAFLVKSGWEEKVKGFE